MTDNPSSCRTQATRRRLTLLLLSVVLGFTAAPALAIPVPFSGTITRSNPLAGPIGRCASLDPPALTIINNNEGDNIAVGTSSLGDFTFTASECIRFPPGISFDGIFEILFDDGGTIFGTRSSVPTPTPTPGLISFVGTVLVAGGTGQFEGATGSFVENGILDRRAPDVATTEGTFEGTLNIIPEPAAIGLFGLGGLALVVMRRRKANAA